MRMTEFGIPNRIVSRTHFRRREHAKFVEWEWYWSKQSPNGEKIAAGGEGYDQLRSSLNGFFANEGMPDWKPMSISPGKIAMPPGYSIEKFADDHYVITQFADETASASTDNDEEDTETNGN